jgi:hypothetical protein
MLTVSVHTYRQQWSSLQEMAERRQRKAADRRLISDRTAKGLRTLASPQRVYRDRNGRGVSSHRPLNLTDYLSVPPDEMELDDDNDSLESMIDHSGTIEGARMNTDLYDAYANPGPCSSSSLASVLFSLILNPTQPPLNPIYPPRHPTCVICCARPTGVRIGFSSVTPHLMGGALHPQPQRRPRRRSPASRP